MSITQPIPGPVRWMSRRALAVLAVLVTVLACAGASADRAHAYQVGWDRDHLWFKVGKSEVVGAGATLVLSRVCAQAAARGGKAGIAVGAVACPVLVRVAVARLPYVGGGFWGEVYTDLRVRYGTW